MKKKKISSGADEFFEEAVMLLAEEEGSEWISANRKNAGYSLPDSDDEKIFLFKLKRAARKHRAASKRRRRITAAAAAACFMICAGVSGALYSIYHDANAQKEHFFGNIFVYANEKQYDFDYEKSLILPDSKIESNNDYEAPSVAVSGFIIGIDDSEIADMTYSCKSGRLFSTLKTEKSTGKTSKSVSFSYYDGYYRDLKWIGDPESVFNEAENDNPDYSKIEADTLAIDMTMKDGSKYSLKVFLSYTSEGYLQAELSGYDRADTH